jgi:hypothetical protein
MMKPPPNGLEEEEEPSSMPREESPDVEEEWCGAPPTSLPSRLMKPPPSVREERYNDS